MTIDPTLLSRSDEKCELCGPGGALQMHEVPSAAARDDAALVVCETCAPQLRDGAELDANHWYCLQGSIWSEVPAVQAISFRLLHRLDAELWAQELIGQAYLADDVLAWANEGLATVDDGPEVLDSNGARLAEGDSVTLIKDLDVKGASFVAKRGTLVRSIHLTDNPGHVEGRVNGTAIVLKTEFLKKA